MTIFSGAKVPLVAWVCAWALPACGAAGATSGEPRGPGSPDSLEVERQVITAEDGTSLSELFGRGKWHFDRAEFREAAEVYSRVYQLEPEGALAPHALLNAGHSYDQAGELALAEKSYQRLLSEFPSSELSRSALMRAVRILGYLERWAEAGRLADVGIQRFKDLAPLELISMHAARALAAVEAGDLPRANREVERGRTLAEGAELDRAGRLPTDLAQLYFALGEVRRLKGEAIQFSPTPPNFADVLEERCQLLLDAQSAYSDTMRAYDAHWSAMAGFRVGELYQRLHEDLMRVPPPAGAKTEKDRQLFEGAMRLRYSVLLRKGQQMMEHTLSMAARTGEQSSWVARASRSKQELEAAIRAEEAALDKLPYTRAELRAALDDLAAKYQVN
ncbi:MAG: hypothetical protein KIT72_17240 [Polyangiaceae bacterium]|nr:hypothetical protein [Polyangiaceae bacterium]MCW5792164.1 hypothetical protein [Polyangiaceae bacterium]